MLFRNSIILILLPFISSCQKCFIGLTEDQVEDYWSTRVSVIYFNHYQDSAKEESYFVIFKGHNPADFSATFKKGKCSSHETTITYEQTSIMEARLQKMGCYYNKKDDCWYNSNKTVKWYITSGGDFMSLICEKINK